MYKEFERAGSGRAAPGSEPTNRFGNDYCCFIFLRGILMSWKHIPTIKTRISST